MKNHDSSGLRDALINGVLLFLALMIVGTASNAFILLVGWCITLPAFEVGLAWLDAQMLWFFLAFFSMLICMAGIFPMSYGIGSLAAQFRIGHRLPRILSIPAMIGIFTIGFTLYGIPCAALAFLAMESLFFAGPLQYIARFIGKGERTLFAEEAFDFSNGVIAAAVLIYLILMLAASAVGYIVGHRRKIARQNRADADDAAEKRKNERNFNHPEAAELHEPNLPPPPEEKILRKKLPPALEAALRKKNFIRQLLTVAFLLAWIAVDVFLWIHWAESRGTGLLDAYNVPFVALLIVPFYPMHLHDRLIGKTYYGTVVGIERQDIRVNYRAATVSHRSNSTNTRQKYTLVLRAEHGLSIRLPMSSMPPFDYRPDDPVFKLSAYPHPIPCSEEDERIMRVMRLKRSGPRFPQ